MNGARYEITPIGHVESPLRERSQAPRQGDEGAPDAWLVLEAAVRDPARPVLGVFSTRSPERPNPIGLHDVQIIAVDGDRIRVRNLEALDNTPIVDIKATLGPLAVR